ncbi:hypothetical protein LRP88_14371 [Fusarium phalaenopsidis]
MDLDDDDDIRPKFQRLKAKIRDIVDKRCRQVIAGILGAQWALYKKEQCEALTMKLLGLIAELENAVALEGKLDELSHSESETIGDSLKTLLEAIGDVDPRLQKAASQTMEDQVELKGINFTTATNYRVQMDVNRGNMQGLIFGTGNTAHRSYGQNSQSQQSKPPRG